jgi:hypothetical protein
MPLFLSLKIISHRQPSLTRSIAGIGARAGLLIRKTLKFG